MRYQRSYGFVFQNANWPLNVLAGSACLLLPVIGWALFIGYLVDLVENLQQRPDGDGPVFDIDRVGHYLARGFLPALMQFVVFAPVLILGALAVGATVLGGDPSKGPGTFAKLLASGLPIAILLAALLLSLFVVPMTLYLGLSAEVAVGAAGRFVVDFLKHVWREALLAQVFILVTGLALTALGVLLCGLGAPPAAAVAGFAQYHLLGQLYDLYLRRGGAAIPRPEPEPAPSNA
jgi:hypothetical protein